MCTVEVCNSRKMKTRIISKCSQVVAREQRNNSLFTRQLALNWYGMSLWPCSHKAVATTQFQEHINVAVSRQKWKHSGSKILLTTAWLIGRLSYIQASSTVQTQWVNYAILSACSMCYYWLYTNQWEETYNGNSGHYSIWSVEFHMLYTSNCIAVHCPVMRQKWSKGILIRTHILMILKVFINLGYEVSRL